MLAEMIVNKEMSLEMYIDKWRFLGEKPCRARAVRVGGWVLSTHVLIGAVSASTTHTRGVCLQ